MPGFGFAHLKSQLEVTPGKQKNIQWLQANRSKCHLRLAKASKNPVLEVLMNGLILLLRKYFKDFHDVDFEQRSLISHIEILDSIENKDSEKARMLMEKYIIGMRYFLHKTYPGNNN